MSQLTFHDLPIPNGLSYCEGEFECDISGYRVTGQWCVDWNDRGNARAFMAGVDAIYAGDELIEYLDRTWAFELTLVRAHIDEERRAFLQLVCKDEVPHEPAIARPSASVPDKWLNADQIDVRRLIQQLLRNHTQTLRIIVVWIHHPISSSL